jgi:hypothetical protein
MADKFLKYTRPVLPKGVGEYYAELCEETDLYCVFHTEGNGFAFSSHASFGEADKEAKRLNGESVVDHYQWEQDHFGYGDDEEGE